MKPIKLLGYTTAALVCLLAAVLLFAPHTAYADACTSTGTGAWETSGNWSCSKVPDSSDSVTIANGHTITIGTGSEDAYYVGDVTVDAGGTLILARGIRVVNTPFDVNGTLRLNAGGFVELGNIPLYGSGSTLMYNRTWTLNNTEWNIGTSGEERGVPYHVVINPGVTVTTSDAGTRAIRGNITISSSNGKLVHASGSGEILLFGNWTNNVGTNGFTQTSTNYVTFAGTTPQTIGGTGVTTFYRLKIANVAEDVTLTQNVTSSGLCLVTGRLNFANKFIDGSGAFEASSGATLTIGSPQGIVDDWETGNIRVEGGQSYGPLVNYVFKATSAQVTGSNMQTAVNNLTIDNSAGVTLSKNITSLSGELFLSNGRLTLGSYSIVLAQTGSIGGTFNSSNMVVADGGGTLRKRSSGAFNVFTFPVGDSSGNYTPVVLNCTTLTQDKIVAVKLSSVKHSEMTGDNYLKRYWTVTSTTPVEMDCTNTKFYYVQSDVQGDESQLTPVKYDAATGWRVLLNRSMDTVNNVMTGGFTSLSDFSAGQPGPLSVALAEFDAQQVDDSVLVSWETNSELNNRGFNLYRGVSPDGWDRRLNDALIPSQSQGSPGGFFYTWQDRADLQSGQTYWYWLEDLDINGATTLHGPVSALYLAPTAVTLNSVSASPVSAAALPWLWTAAAAGLALGVSRRRR